MIWAAVSAAVVGIAASGHAQTTAQPQAQAQAQAKADECQSRPGTTTPKGSHWFYRLDRQTKRRCWYLGPAGQKVRAERTAPERAEASERRAVPLPAPAPSELRADEQVRDATPAPVTSQMASDTPAAASSVTATQFSAAWPAGSSALSDREVPPPIVQERVEEGATADAQAEEMPPVWPVMTAAERAATAQAEGTPGIGHLLIFLAATVAFVAIAIRTVLKFTTSARRRHELTPRVRVAEPVIRPRAAQRAADPFRKEGSIEAMSEPTIARLREIARRWDAPTRVPRQPRLPAYEVVPEYEVKPPPRRRAMA